MFLKCSIIFALNFWINQELSSYIECTYQKHKEMSELLNTVIKKKKTLEIYS